ncbi:hypothetical protein LO771_17805 [Streptacidiphilus sp. ASG 303]|uniref:hypothetical protein n=1 Tax=Streptacidiphilus sp. ASG 303 TaxID=2896847 RepID=UPI001E63F141|nr:hypothetical protein [Streptacidiphilus sp. ASG 303]MCD0484197.1 hypothetical protein [Streptacidiphilus sp. ASG 303]
MSRRRTVSRRQRGVLFACAAAVVCGGVAVTVQTSQAAVDCAGLASRLRETQDLVAAQRAHPVANSAAVIANRQAVADLLGQQLAQGGCAAPQAAPRSAPPSAAAPGGVPAPAGAVTVPPPAGEVVCAGATVTLSGEAGAPAASSDRFPVGTRLRVTNLDNGRSTSVAVTGPSGSCALLNDAAFDRIREPGRNLVRHARIERLR